MDILWIINCKINAKYSSTGSPSLSDKFEETPEIPSEPRPITPLVYETSLKESKEPFGEIFYVEIKNFVC